MGKILYHSFQEINEALRENPSNDDMVRYLYSDIQGDANLLIIEFTNREMLDHLVENILYNVIKAMIKIEDMLRMTPPDRGVGRTRIGINLYFSADRHDIQNLKIYLLGEKAGETGQIKRKGGQDIEKQLEGIEKKDITDFLTEEILSRFLRKMAIFESWRDKNNEKDAKSI